jgi:hypothetical protein
MRAAIVLVVVLGCGGAKAPSPEQPRNASPPPAHASAPPAAHTGGRGDGFATKEALYAATIAALKTKSATPLVPALPTAAVFKKGCPALLEERDAAEIDKVVASAESQTQTKIERCWESQGDLGTAMLVEARDEHAEPDDQCPGMTNGKVQLVIKSGGTQIVARIRWVMLEDGSIYLDDPPQCES